jgi:hypothetical protein
MAGKVKIIYFLDHGINPIQVGWLGGGGSGMICSQLPRLIGVLITYRTDPKWFGNSSLVILSTLKWFLGSINKFGPPGGPLDVEGPTNEILSKFGKSTLSAFWSY